jgi:hypothetical protein
VALVVASTLLTAGACTDDEPEQEPAPVEDPDDEDDERRATQGLRVGVVLPAADVGVADETDVEGFDELETLLEGEVAELRTVVPDGEAFVADVATLLTVEGYDVVCVFGRDAHDVVVDLAARHVATRFCAAPAEPTAEPGGNLVAVDVATEELGHVIGVALHELAGEDPAALLGAGDRVKREAFRDGLRAGLQGTPLQEAHGGLGELEAELSNALGAEVAAIAVDAGSGARDLLERELEPPMLAPAPLLEAEVGALRWRMRWDRVLEAVLRWHLDPEEERPAILGASDDVFMFEHGPRSSSSMRDAVDEAIGELQRGARDPLEDPAE